MTKRTVYFVTGYLVMLGLFALFQVRAEQAFAGRMSAGFLTGAFLTVYGALSALVMVVLYKRLNRFEAQIVSSLLALSLGVWTILLCREHVPYFALRTPGALTGVMSHLCVPLAYAYPALKPGRLRRRLFRLTAAFSAVLAIVLIPFHGVGAQTLYLLLAAGAFGFAVRMLSKDFSQTRAFSTEIVLQLSFTGLCVLMLFNAVLSVLREAGVTDGALALRLIYPFFASLVLMAMTFAFSLFVSESYAKYDENAVLFHAAYEDPLTGLSNRAAWDEKMKEVDEQPGPFCVISLDLDGLKGVNDTWGHEAGDRLIKGFARCLADAFSEPHFLARIGGDEFCVIMENVTEEEVKRCLKSLDTRLGVLNRRDKEVNHSCSYGYAFRDEEHNTSHEIYLVADEKMYATKQMHKAQRKADALTKQDSAETRVAQMVSDALAAMSPEIAKEAATEAQARYSRTPDYASPEAKAAAVAQKPRPAPKPARMMNAKELRRARLPKEEVSLRALQKIQDTEVRQVAKEVRVKKALKALQDAQEAQKTQSGNPKP